MNLTQTREGYDMVKLFTDGSEQTYEGFSSSTRKSNSPPLVTSILFNKWFIISPTVSLFMSHRFVSLMT